MRISDWSSDVCSSDLKHDGRRQLLDFLDDHRGHAGIVYCLSRRKVEATAEYLAGHGIQALPYHAGLDAAVRAGNQRRFLREDGIVKIGRASCRERGWQYV